MLVSVRKALTRSSRRYLTTSSSVSTHLPLPNTEDYPTATRGLEIPCLGLGTWKSSKGKTGDAVKTALECGYRMIDTANDYGNEAEVGAAIKHAIDGGVLTRDELFVQSKLWNSNHRKEHVKADLMATLKDLQLSYVDSFVIHWPQAVPSTGKRAEVCVDGDVTGMFPVQANGYYASDNASHFIETWHAMEELVTEGLCRTIGLSNFNRTQINEVLDEAHHYRPVLLQNECHPYLQQKDLHDFCRHQGIVFQAYSPLGSRDRPWFKKGDIDLLKDDETLSKIAAAHNKSSAQVVLRWHIQRHNSAVPKSVTPQRIKENYQVFDFELTRDEMDAIGRLNIGWRHLLWPETAMHPDYPFKDEFNGPVPKVSATSTAKIE